MYEKLVISNTKSNMNYFIYRSMRDRPLGTSNSMQPTLSSEEEKSIERVHQWIAQQHKFAGIPPPEEEPSAQFRSQSTADITSKDVSCVSEATTFNDWVPMYRSEDEVFKFSGLEVNRYYSPNMTRRRGYIPRSDPSLNTTQHVNNNRTNLTQLPTRQHNGDMRGSPLACSPRGSSVACSPLSSYFYRLGEGNTFPRRNKASNKDDQRNLFASPIMNQQLEKLRPSSSGGRIISNQYSARTISNQSDERTTSNQYDGRMTSNQYEGRTTSNQYDGRTTSNQYDGRTTSNQYDGRTTSNQYDGRTTSNQYDGRTTSNQYDGRTTSNQYDGRTTSNQYDGRTSSNQYDERTISNRYDRSQHSTSESVDHVTEDEITFITENRSFVSNGMKLGVTQKLNNMLAENNNTLIGSMSLDTQRLLSGNLPDVALTAAKAIHKRELSDTLPKYKGAMDCLFNHVRISSAPETSSISCGEEKIMEYSVKRTPCEVRKVKAASWPKRATLPSYKDFMKGELTKNNNPMKTESGYNTEKSEEKNDLVIADQDEFIERVDCLCAESVHSDPSDLPPARPPLPSQKSYCETKLSSKDAHLSCHDVHSKSSIADDHLSSIGSTPEKTIDTFHPYSNLKYSRGRDYTGDCTVSAFCSSTTDLTRNVSMSLKDLIRIHELEIARVSGGGSTRLKGTDSMHEKYRKSSMADLKGKSKPVWKRHTTIGLLTHCNGVDTDKDILDYRTTDKLPLSMSPDDEAETSSEKSNVVYQEPNEADNISLPSSSNASPVKCGRKRNGPLTLPKPSKSSLNSLLLDTSQRHNKITEIIKPEISKSPLSPLYKDACIQTDVVPLDLNKNELDETEHLINEKKELENKFEKEKKIMHRKLEEQKKVANAYQKLEDRYRRKVYELQKALHMCTCSRGNVPVKLDTGHLADSR